MRVSVLALSLAAAAGISPAAYAQNASSAELAALREQIKMLESKVTELEERAERMLAGLDDRPHIVLHCSPPETPTRPHCRLSSPPA